MAADPPAAPVHDTPFPLLKAEAQRLGTHHGTVVAEEFGIRDPEHARAMLLLLDNPTVHVSFHPRMDEAELEDMRGQLNLDAAYPRLTDLRLAYQQAANDAANRVLRLRATTIATATDKTASDPMPADTNPAQPLYRVRIINDPGYAEHPTPRADTNLGVLVLDNTGYPDLPCEGPLADTILRHLRDGVLGDSPSPGTSVNDRTQARLDTLAGWLHREHGVSVMQPVWMFGDALIYAGQPHCDVYGGLERQLAGIIYDTPATRAMMPVPDNDVSARLIAEVDKWDQWARGQLYAYAIEARVAEDSPEWRRVTTVGGFYSERDAQDAGERAIPTTYPWFSGPNGEPKPGDTYEGHVVVACDVLARPPAEPTRYRLLLVRSTSPHYILAHVDAHGRRTAWLEQTNRRFAFSQFIDPQDGQSTSPTGD